MPTIGNPWSHRYYPENFGNIQHQRHVNALNPQPVDMDSCERSTRDQQQEEVERNSNNACTQDPSNPQVVTSFDSIGDNPELDMQTHMSPLSPITQLNTTIEVSCVDSDQYTKQCFYPLHYDSKTLQPMEPPPKTRRLQVNSFLVTSFNKSTVVITFSNITHSVDSILHMTVFG